MHAALYARQSAGDEQDSTSVNDQLTACRKLAESRGLTVVGEHSDLNTSGSTYPSGAKDFASSDKAWSAYRKTNQHVDSKPWRDGLERALGSGAEWLVCYDLTRLARATSGSYLDTYLRQRLADASMRLLTVHSGEVDFSKFETDVMATLQSKIEADAKERLRKRSMTGLKALRDMGGALGGRRVFGYKRTGKQQHDVVPAEAVIIQRIYALYKDIKSKNQVYRVLKSEGAPVRWDTVRRILENPFYAALTKNSAGELIESITYPAIIPRADWWAAQNRQPLGKRDTKRQHYFKGVCHCGGCGKQMYFSKHPSKDAAYIFCTNGRETLLNDRDDGCKRSRVIEWFDVKPNLNKLRYLGLADSLFPLAMLAAERLEKDKATSKNDDGKRLLIHNDLVRLDNKEKEMQALYLDDSLSSDAFKGGQKTIKERRAALKASLSAMGAPASPVEYNIGSLRQRVISRDLAGRELEELLHLSLKRVDMSPWSIGITLYNDIRFDLPRLRLHNGRTPPSWWADLGSIYYFAASWYDNPKFEEIGDGARWPVIPVVAGRTTLLAEVAGDKIYLVS